MIRKTFLQLSMRTRHNKRCKYSVSKIIWGYIKSEPSKVDETCSERTPPNVYCILLMKLCLETNVAFILSKRIEFIFFQNSFQPFICPFLFLSLSHQFSSNILLVWNVTAWAWSLDLFRNHTYSQTARQQISFLLCYTECQLFVCFFRLLRSYHNFGLFLVCFQNCTFLLWEFSPSRHATWCVQCESWRCIERFELTVSS